MWRSDTRNVAARASAVRLGQTEGGNACSSPYLIGDGAGAGQKRELNAQVKRFPQRPRTHAKDLASVRQTWRWPAQCDLRVGDDASISTALGRPPPTALGSCSQKISRGPIELADACARADSEFGRLQAAGGRIFGEKVVGSGPVRSYIHASVRHPATVADP